MNLVKFFLAAIVAFVFLSSPAFAQTRMTPQLKGVMVEFPADQLREAASCARMQSDIFGALLPDDPDKPQPLVTTCSAGVGESCATFASNCLADGGYYDGDGAGGTCCSGVDHPDNNPGSACS